MADVIRCDLYDHFEIACMRRENVELQMIDGERIQGRAIDLQTKEGREWLVLDQLEPQPAQLEPQPVQLEPQPVQLEKTKQRQIDLKKIRRLVFPKTGQSIKITED